jgi:C-terminal domain found in long catalases
MAYAPGGHGGQPDQPGPALDDDHLRQLSGGGLPSVIEGAQTCGEEVRIPSPVRVMRPDELPAADFAGLGFVHLEAGGRLCPSAESGSSSGMRFRLATRTSAGKAWAEAGRRSRVRAAASVRAGVLVTPQHGRACAAVPGVSRQERAVVPDDEVSQAGYGRRNAARSCDCSAATALVIAPVGGVLGSGTHTEAVDRTLLTARSVEFDALVVAGGTTATGDIKLTLLLQRHSATARSWPRGATGRQSRKRPALQPAPWG